MNGQKVEDHVSPKLCRVYGKRETELFFDCPKESACLMWMGEYFWKRDQGCSSEKTCSATWGYKTATPTNHVMREQSSFAMYIGTYLGVRYRYIHTSHFRPDLHLFDTL